MPAIMSHEFKSWWNFLYFPPIHPHPTPTAPYCCCSDAAPTSLKMCNLSCFCVYLYVEELAEAGILLVYKFMSPGGQLVWCEGCRMQDAGCAQIKLLLNMINIDSKLGC